MGASTLSGCIGFMKPEVGERFFERLEVVAVLLAAVGAAFRRAVVVFFRVEVVRRDRVVVVPDVLDLAPVFLVVRFFVRVAMASTPELRKPCRPLRVVAVFRIASAGTDAPNTY